MYPGEFCETIFNDESQALMFSDIPKGAVYELSLLRRALQHTNGFGFMNVLNASVMLLLLYRLSHSR